MDPDANLNQQLALASRILYEGVPNPADAERLAALVESMHYWLSKGGALPAAWQRRADDTPDPV